MHACDEIRQFSTNFTTVCVYVCKYILTVELTETQIDKDKKTRYSPHFMPHLCTLRSQFHTDRKWLFVFVCMPVSVGVSVFVPVAVCVHIWAWEQRIFTLCMFRYVGKKYTNGEKSNVFDVGYAQILSLTHSLTHSHTQNQRQMAKHRWLCQCQFNRITQ